MGFIYFFDFPSFLFFLNIVNKMPIREIQNSLKKFFYTRILFQITNKHSLPDCFLSINTYKYNRKTIKNIIQNIKGIIKYTQSLYKLNNKYFHSIYIDGKETLSLDYFKILHFTEEGMDIEDDYLYDVEPFRINICIFYCDYPKAQNKDLHERNNCFYCLDIGPQVVFSDYNQEIKCPICGKVNRLIKLAPFRF